MTAVETAGALGTVVALWRYPVKSMMGEELNAADLTERGVHDDRAYALIDTETCKLANGLAQMQPMKALTRELGPSIRSRPDRAASS